MSTYLEEPRFAPESLRLLDQFQESLRNRVYNLVEDHVRETGDYRISPQVLEKCLKRAIQEYIDPNQQRGLF